MEPVAPWPTTEHALGNNGYQTRCSVAYGRASSRTQSNGYETRCSVACGRASSRTQSTFPVREDGQRRSRSEQRVSYPLCLGRAPFVGPLRGPPIYCTH